MNARLTPGILLVGLAVGTLLGPLGTLREVTVADLDSAAYWRGILADAIRAGATALTAELSVLGAALGLPLFRRQGGESPAEPPSP